MSRIHNAKNPRQPRTAWDATELFYKGYDINPYWAPVHNTINQYVNLNKHMSSEFKNKNIFETLAFIGLRTYTYPALTRFKNQFE
mgnify:CR=1 FL=1